MPRRSKKSRCDRVCQTSWFTSSKSSLPYVVWSQAWHTKSDESCWRCGRPCNKTLSIRSGWFFEGSHLSIQSVLDVTRYWSFEEFSFRKASRELAMAEHIFVDFVSDICAEHYLQNPVRIRGVGVEVQIDACDRSQKTQR